VPESRTKTRTRAAILTAAASLLSRDRAATLAQIADAAGVGRSSLHRYFPDRELLLHAVVEDSVRRLDQSIREAALTEGSPQEALRRLITAMMNAGDQVLFLFGDPNMLRLAQPDTTPDPATEAITALIARARSAGLFTPETPRSWITSALWSLVYAGCEAVNRDELPRHGAATTVIQTFESGLLR
jgi:AcrR family transcriptional regulator